MSAFPWSPAPLRRAVLLLCMGASLAAAAQSYSAPAPLPIRYHFGDDPRFSAPTFDDSTWPIAANGQFSLPPFHSDGYVWIRTRIPVRPDAESPHAVLLDGNENQWMADQLYVNGFLVGQQGSLASKPAIDPASEPAVFDLPIGAVTPGTTVVVALRAWYMPGARTTGSSAAVRFTIDSSRFVHLARRARHQHTLISLGPELGANLLITCLGLGLLLLWRGGGGRDILLCSALLLLYAPIGIVSDLQRNGVLHPPWVVYQLFFTLVLSAQMACLIEFIWTTHGLRARLWKRLAQVALIVYNGTLLILELDTHPSPLVAGSLLVCLVSVYAFDAIAFSANLWALLVLRRNTLIAASLALIPLAATLGRLGILTHFDLGPFYLDDFNVAFLLSALALFIMLGRRAWGSWREGNQLRAEFDAAREVQERLVVAPPEIPGFRMESAYLPATHVGGDFYHIRPDDKGGIQIAIGDVSGKGLRAAMTVSAIVGALRAMPMLPPSRVLFDLNRGLTGNLRGGFVTCCVTHIAANGSMRIANAGHLPPYRNGVELDGGSSLPLGITTTTFDEHEIQLAPGDTLTFLSDGVVEARNARGELFGFDRTQKISRQSAADIAAAAQRFGQEDDITVLTLFFAGVVAHA
jgi:sigma-B regulation protein RsbU (phosphoserine phosphatase)